MTYQAPHRGVHFARALLAAGLLLALSVSPLSAEEPAALPEGVVAIVRAGPEDREGRHLTFENFCYAASQQSLSDLKRQRSGARQVLEQLIEERMCELECKTLGIVVQAVDVQTLWNDLDTKVRRRSGGSRTLRETIEEQGTTESEFREQLWHILRKERIAKHPKYLGPNVPANEDARIQQIGIVIAKVREHTKVEYGLLTIDHLQQKQRPKDLGAGVAATVSGTPITTMEYGRALVIRLPGNQVREYLDRECKTALMTMQGVGLTDEQLKAEVDHLEALWPLERELKRDEVWKTVSFKDRFETQFNMTIEDVMNSRYARGLLGLVRQMRADVTAEEVQAEFDKEEEGQYGPYILADVIEIGFSQKKGFSSGGRTLGEARRIATDFANQLARGEAYERVASSVNMQQDRSQRARTLRLTNTDNDRVHYQQATRHRDGDVSAPYETLAEVCVMRRVGPRPGRTLESVDLYVREVVARRKAREWIEDKIKDAAWVQIRWPLPERK
ncbi:MAG: hypothetical protein O2894_06340 [Planctomycetota bacterium]|nr:hypothetical protein [Planctomycetota bacterium]